MKAPEKSVDRVDNPLPESSPPPAQQPKPERPERVSVTPPTAKLKAGSSADIPDKKSSSEVVKEPASEANLSQSMDRSSDAMSESTTSCQSEG